MGIAVLSWDAFWEVAGRTGPLTTIDQCRILASIMCGNERASVVTRRYGEQWGDDYRAMKELESLGYMEFVLQRRGADRSLIRRSQITHAGREVYKEMMERMKPHLVSVD